MGKTEAGLLWIGDTKGFFVLPIRTAINAIYDRVRNGLFSIYLKAYLMIYLRNYWDILL